MNKMIKTMKQGFISATVVSLLQSNNSITILEVKAALRSNYPEFNWPKQEVVDFMHNMHLAGELTYEDNGTFRTYHGEVEKKNVTKKDATGKKLGKIKAVGISKTKAFDLMTGNKGYFFTAEFIKKDGKTRVINCQCIKEQDFKLGYVKVKEASKMRTDPDKSIRQINMQTLKALKIGGVAYKVK